MADITQHKWPTSLRIDHDPLFEIWQKHLMSTSIGIS
jgi:hypothetical protein